MPDPEQSIRNRGNVPAVLWDLALSALKESNEASSQVDALIERARGKAERDALVREGARRVIYLARWAACWEVKGAVSGADTSRRIEAVMLASHGIKALPFLQWMTAPDGRPWATLAYEEIPAIIEQEEGLSESHKAKAEALRRLLAVAKPGKTIGEAVTSRQAEAIWQEVTK